MTPTGAPLSCTRRWRFWQTLAATAFVLGCSENEARPRESICSARSADAAVQAEGTFDLEMWGAEAKPISEWEPHVLLASADSITVEACSPPGERDWHFLGTWSGIATTPAEIRLDDAAVPHFEGELKGVATAGGDLINSIFETVPVPAVAASGGGVVSSYDPVAGVFAGHLDVHVFETSEFTHEAAGAQLDFDLTF